VLVDIKEDIESLPTVDEETNKYIGQSLQDIKEGRYIVAEPNDKSKLDELAGLR
jgi:tRNA uridine 5-carbamoylmethylation protein Kti12